MVTLKRSLFYFGAGVLLGWGTSSWVRWAYQQLLSIVYPFGESSDNRHELLHSHKGLELHTHDVCSACTQLHADTHAVA